MKRLTMFIVLAMFVLTAPAAAQQAPKKPTILEMKVSLLIKKGQMEIIQRLVNSLAERAKYLKIDFKQVRAELDLALDKKLQEDNAAAAVEAAKDSAAVPDKPIGNEDW